MIIEHDSHFENKIKKIKDERLKSRVKKQIAKILAFPEVGKPMRFSRKGIREVYIQPFRPSYSYFKNENKIVFLDLYHKDEQ